VTDSDIRDRIAGLFSEQHVAVLSTDAESQPYATLVGFMADGQLEHIYFFTTRATRKFAALSANPRVALLIDNRTNQSKDFREAVAVTALGEAREVEKEEHQHIVRAYLEKLPHLAEFTASPTSALVCISVSAYYMVTRFQHVMELHIRK
jgi:nitroimidazol reductase NimA-like FMN-containing flavoprotein (pyridoxamine 5'-phosphate oxidase superfamily)